MTAFLSAAPILLVLALILGARMSAAAAGGAAVTLALALSLTGVAGSLDMTGVIGSVAEGVFLAATILWILIAALSIHQLQTDGGALTLLKDSLAGFASSRMALALIVGWFFALFLEGVAGFGTPVALAAPLLVGFGFAPVQAVAIALIGHAGGVAFGAVGTPVLAQELLVGLSAGEIAAWTGILNAVIVAVLMAFFALAARGGSDDVGSSMLPAGALAAGGFLLPMVAVAVLVGPELPTVIGALLGGAAFVAFARHGAPEPDGATPWRAIAIAAAPYLATVGLIILTRLAPPLRAALSGPTVEWTLFSAFGGSFEPLYHPGTMLILGLLIGAMVQRRPWGAVGASMAAAARRLAPVALALVVMLSLSRVMLHAGMIEALAEAAAAGAGDLWPLAAPAVGALGSFVTGSATASNILFTNLQATAAADLGLPVVDIVAGQGIGAAVGNIISPLNVIAGAATVGLAGREGQILRKTVPACLACAAAAGVAVFAVANMGGIP